MLPQKIRDMFPHAGHYDEVLPDYKENCFANIPSAVAHLLGVQASSPLGPILDAAKITPGPQKVVLFFVDGFGYTQWLRYTPQFETLKRFYRDGSLAPLTSIFPSTTAAALTAVHSGFTPMEHGLPEWWVYFRELGKIVTTLPFTLMGEKGNDQLLAAGVDPKILFNGTTLYEKLAASGVSSTVLVDADYAHGAYSSLVHRGSTTLPFADVRNMFDTLRRHLESSSGPSYTFVYWANIDAIAHEFGPHSDEYRKSLHEFFDAFETEFVAKLSLGAARDLTLLMTADHGQILVDPKRTVYLDCYPEVVDNLRVGPEGKKILPWGSPRDMFLAVQPEEIDSVVDFLERTLDARVVRSTDALAAGLFGKGVIHPEFTSRIGDILIIPHGDGTVWYEHTPGKKFNLHGMHGGLHKEEMLVPFALLKGDRLNKP